MNLKRGLKNISYSVIGQIITLVIGIFIPQLVIVSYGSEINGLLSTTSTIISYLALLEAGVGAATCQALYKPIYNDDRRGINQILSATNIYYKRAGSAYFFLILLISILYPLVIPSNLSYWFMFIIILINGLPGVINFLFHRKYISFLEAMGENYIIINLQTIITVFASLIKIVLLRLNVSIIIVQLIYCITTLGQMIFILSHIRKKYGWINIHDQPDYKALNQKNAALVHQICSLVTNSTDVIILSMFCDLNTVSIYAVYNMIFAIVYNTIFSVNSGLQYMLGQAYCKSKEYYCNVIDTYETYYVAIASALLLVTFVMIVPFLKLYTAGADISYIDKYMPFMFMLVKLLNSFRNTSLNTITVSGNLEQTKQYAIIESIINLTISIISVWKFGMVGVLFGTAVAFFYRCIVSIRFSNKNILQRSCTHSLLVIIRNLTLILLIIYLLSGINLDCSNYVVFFARLFPLTIISLLLFLAINSIFDYRQFKLLKISILDKLKRRI